MVEAPAPGQLVELRNYVLAPGAAEAFVEHFERRFLESQEELGMDIVGQFTVPGDDARFVWIRRFLQPSNRGAALRAFYTGPVWKEFGPRANELMLDHTDVHLLVPDPSAPDFASGHQPHAGRPATGEPASTVVAAVYDLDFDGTAMLPADITAAMTTLAAAAGSDVVELGRLVSARVLNEFPRLPVHDATVAVWLLSDRSGSGSAPDIATGVAQALASHVGLMVRTLPLTPTTRSSLR